MQTELLDINKWKTRVELSTAILDWIEVFFPSIPAPLIARQRLTRRLERRHHQPFAA